MFYKNPNVQTGPTDLPKKEVKKWDNFGNFWPIVLKIGIQVNLTKPLATVMFF